MPNLRLLVEVVLDARLFVTRPDNDFSWSGWADEGMALHELDAIWARIRTGSDVPSSLDMLFLPTGPLQELSLSSGWGDEFAALADRFDAACCADGEEACACFRPTPSLLEYERAVGMDDRFAEISIWACPLCGQKWLNYHYENEGITGSGHWIRGAVSRNTADSVRDANARDTLSRLLWYFEGGTALSGQIRKSQGNPLHIV